MGHRCWRHRQLVGCVVSAYNWKWRRLGFVTKTFYWINTDESCGATRSVGSEYKSRRPSVESQSDYH